MPCIVPGVGVSWAVNDADLGVRSYTCPVYDLLDDGDEAWACCVRIPKVVVCDGRGSEGVVFI
jgi:hypothetical protein